MVQNDLSSRKEVVVPPEQMEHAGTMPLIIAHRGDSANAPENTLASIRAAIKAGADGVEFDVRLARDGVPVVIHDATLKRTARLNARVAGLSSHELGKIDAGSWFNARHPKRARTEFSKESVPTLARVLELLSNLNGLIYIELKCSAGAHSDLVSAVCEILADSPLLSRIIIKSFRLATIADVRDSLPGVQTAALFEPSILHVLRRRRYIIDRAKKFRAHQLSLHSSLVTPRLAQLAQHAKMPLTVWTVDDPKWIERARRLNITALITNDPRRLLLSTNEDSKDHIRQR